MSAAAGERLAEAIGTSLASGTIEWGANLEVCEVLEANPSLAPAAMRGIRAALKKKEPVPVLLALSLLEMIVKNCGIAACRAIDERLAKSLLEVIKFRESWQYGIGRNLHKYGASFLPSHSGVDESERGHWLKAKQKVLEILQLSVDAFMLHEGELRPLFVVYKQLRKEGYEFPGRSAAGAGAAGASSANSLALVRGSQESPAYLAGLEAGGGAPPSPPQAPASPAPAPASPAPASPAPAAAAPAPAGGAAGGLSSEEVQELRAAVAALTGAAGAEPPDAGARAVLRARLQAARPRVLAAIQESAEGSSEELDEVILHGLLALLEDLDRALEAGAPSASSGAASSGAAAPAAGTAPPAAAAAAAAAPAMVDLLDLGGEAAAEGREAAAEAPAEAPREQEQASLEQALATLGELGDMRQLLDRLRAAPEGAERAELLERARAAESRLFLCVGADIADTDMDEVVAILQDMDELLGAEDEEAEQARPAEALPPRPSAKPPSVQEQEMHDLIMARFLQDQELQAARRDEEASRQLALQLASGVEPARARAEALAQTEAWARAWRSQQALPTRAAPPARVIQARNEAPELLIGDGPAAASSAPASGSSASAGGLASKLQGFGSGGGGGFGSQPLSEGLLGGGSSSSSKSKSWARWAPSASSSGKLRSLGDGFGSQSYDQMTDDAAPLVEGSAPRVRGRSKGLLLWKRKAKDEDARESLLSRVRVDDEWELVRPPDERPYWHNSATGVSQWEPPSVVAGQGF